MNAQLIQQFEIPETADCFNLFGESLDTDELARTHHRKIALADDDAQLDLIAELPKVN